MSVSFTLHYPLSIALFGPAPIGCGAAYFDKAATLPALNDFIDRKLLPLNEPLLCRLRGYTVTKRPSLTHPLLLKLAGLEKTVKLSGHKNKLLNRRRLQDVSCYFCGNKQTQEAIKNILADMEVLLIKGQLSKARTNRPPLSLL